MKPYADLLDRIVPLRGASHADVVAYSTDVPMRYTEVFALLADGRQVRLREPRQFAGWTRNAGSIALLLTGDERHVELRMERDGTPQTVTFWQISPSKPNGNARYFVARDGAQFAIELADKLSVMPARQPAPRHATSSLDPYPEWLACRNRAASSAAQ